MSHSTPPLPPVDSHGTPLVCGDTVRIIGMPDLSAMPEETRMETGFVFGYLKGKYKKIRGFDEYGHAEIEFRIPAEGRISSHTVWIEPYLLKKKNHRVP